MKKMLIVLVTLALASFFFSPSFIEADPLPNGRLDPIEPITNCQSTKDIWLFGDTRCYTYWRDEEAEIICGDLVDKKDSRKCIARCDVNKRGIPASTCNSSDPFPQTQTEIKSKVHKITKGSKAYP